MKETITFDELRELAVKEGIKDNKVSVGMWAKFNGYTRYKRRIRDNRIVWTYVKSQNDQ